MYRRFFCFLFFLLPIFLFAQEARETGTLFRPADLALDPGDLKIEQRSDGGFHLFIRKKPGMGSVLLTESTRDPAQRADNYAYRAPEWNAVNGDEIRLLNGEPIPKSNKIWSLVDSTPEPHPDLGEAFHIYIPWILNYGYDYTRHGEVYVVNGTYLNIRSFELPYADYRGRFRDNPFTLTVTQEPLPRSTEKSYMTETEQRFAEITRGGGELWRSSGPSDLVDKIREILENEKGKNLDMVLCLDTTGSMKDDLGAIRKALLPMIEELLPSFPEFRLGMVFYKDYYDEYLTRVVPFTKDFKRFQTILNGVQARGGGDIPEAVHEALYEGAVKFPWTAETRLLVLVGDAPPHIRPRGRITKDMVLKAAGEQNIKIHAIILPQ